MNGVRLFFVSSLITFCFTNINLIGQVNYRQSQRRTTKRYRYTPNRKQNTYIYSFGSSHPGNHHSEAYAFSSLGVSFIACHQKSDNISISFPYQRGTDSFTYNDQLNISGMSAMIPTYDFSLEMGYTKKYFAGLNFFIVNANLPNSRLESSGGVEFFLGYNFKISDKLILKISEAVGVNDMQSNFGVTIPDEKFDVSAFGKAFNAKGKKKHWDRNDDVEIGLQETTNYLKSKLEINYRVSHWIWLYTSIGLRATTKNTEHIVLTNSIVDLSLDPNAKDLTINSQTPLNQLFDLNGFSWSFGIQLRVD